MSGDPFWTKWTPPIGWGSLEGGRQRAGEIVVGGERFGVEFQAHHPRPGSYESLIHRGAVEITFLHKGPDKSGQSDGEGSDPVLGRMVHEILHRLCGNADGDGASASGPALGAIRDADAHPDIEIPAEGDAAGAARRRGASSPSAAWSGVWSGVCRRWRWIEDSLVGDAIGGACLAVTIIVLFIIAGVM